LFATVDDDADIEADYLADNMVRGEVVLEFKAVERLTPLHEAQLLTYLRFAPAGWGC
jgi:GxxExxY protein